MALFHRGADSKADSTGRQVVLRVTRRERNRQPIREEPLKRKHLRLQYPSTTAYRLTSIWSLLNHAASLALLLRSSVPVPLLHVPLLHVPYYMYLATCTLLHVPYYMYLVTCILLHVPYYMYLTTCTLLHVPYYMYLATCILLHASYYMYLTTCTLLHVPCYMYLATCTCPAQVLPRTYYVYQQVLHVPPTYYILLTTYHLHKHT